VAQKSPAEAEEYKRWLVALAQKTAEAAKEGGFLGIGGTRVSEAETSAVSELNRTTGGWYSSSITLSTAKGFGGRFFSCAQNDTIGGSRSKVYECHVG
jgi:hypothetical protein